MGNITTNCINVYFQIKYYASLLVQYKSNNDNGPVTLYIINICVRQNYKKYELLVNLFYKIN